MTRIHCVVREADGLCRADELLVDRDADDVIVYTNAGYPTRMRVSDERTTLRGWGGNDGDAIVLAGDAAWQVLVEVGHARRCQLVA